MPSGRFAPSPTGALHLGNLRTALVAWLFSRVDGSAFRLRFDDLDTGSVRAEHYAAQAADLSALGLDWDGPVIRQSERLELYRHALDRLVADDAIYPCYCSRREIREAARAPNRPLAGHAYPGTCRHLDRRARNDRETAGRRPALRLRVDEAAVGFTDVIVGAVSFAVDDFVVCRNDGTPAYHLVNVVDDDDLDIELVVRADDLLDSTSRQILLCRLLGLRVPAHAHVPLVIASDGERLAKRHGAVTLADRRRLGQSALDVLGDLARSLGFDPHPGDGAADLVDRFQPAVIPRQPLVLTEADLGGDAQNTSSDTV